MLWLASKKLVGDRDLAAAVVATAIRARIISSISSGVVDNTYCDAIVVDEDECDGPSSTSPRLRV